MSVLHFPVWHPSTHFAHTNNVSLIVGPNQYKSQQVLRQIVAAKVKATNCKVVGFGTNALLQQCLPKGAEIYTSLRAHLINSVLDTTMTNHTPTVLVIDASDLPKPLGQCENDHATNSLDIVENVDTLDITETIDTILNLESMRRVCESIKK